MTTIIEEKTIPDAKPLPGKVLLIGASRGLGLALAETWVDAGWEVTATVRSTGATGLNDLATRHPKGVDIEWVDITEPDQIASLSQRLGDRRFDLLFVNAGIANRPERIVAETATDDFTRVMITNALSPLRVIETLQHLVTPTGMIGVMSSGQGSVTNNVRGEHEVYRGSKAALNTFMRSYAARHRDDARPLVLMAPGWVRTDLGGPHARLDIQDSVPNIVATIDALRTRPGLHYVDYLGRTVPW